VINLLAAVSRMRYFQGILKMQLVKTRFTGYEFIVIVKEKDLQENNFAPV